MLIREAKHRDLKQILSMYDDFLAHNAEKQPEFYRAVPVERAYPASLLHSKKAMLFVAADENDHELAGFLHVAEEKTPPYEAYVPYRYASVVDVYVVPQRRGQGIGRALVESARNWALSRGLNYLELMVLEEDLGARTFYRQLGFGEAYRVMRSPTVLTTLPPEFLQEEAPPPADSAPLMEQALPVKEPSAPEEAARVAEKDPLLEDTHEFTI